jgi:hypothetical protein
MFLTLYGSAVVGERPDTQSLIFRTPPFQEVFLLWADQRDYSSRC